MSLKEGALRFRWWWIPACSLLWFTLHASSLSQGADQQSGWVREDAPSARSDRGTAPVRIRLADLPRVSASARVGPRAVPYRTQWAGGKPEPSQPPNRTSPPATAFLAEDPATAPALLATPRLAKSFGGIPYTGLFPPDCTAAAGPDHVVIATNASFAIYSKSGAKKFQSTFTDWFDFLPEVQGAFFFDPKLVYDQHDDHFVMVVDASRDSDTRSWYLLSVSETSDAQGTWWVWALDMQLNGSTPTDDFADFPGVGLDDQGIYLTSNLFSPFAGGPFAYSKLRILDKREVYAFGNLSWFDFFAIQDASGELAFTVQPAHSYDSRSTAYLLSSDSTQSTKLTLYSLKNPVSNSPRLLRKGVTVAAYSFPPEAAQRGGGPLINSGDARLLNTVLRDGSLYATHAVAHDWGSGLVAALRFYQLTLSGSVVQDLTYGADLFHYYYPAIMPNRDGDLALVFCRSSSTEYAAARFTGRRASDPPGSLEASQLLKAGAAHYALLDDIGRNRWGDFSGIASDPEDDSLWIYAQFAKGKKKWGTQVGRLEF